MTLIMSDTETRQDWCQSRKAHHMLLQTVMIWSIIYNRTVSTSTQTIMWDYFGRQEKRSQLTLNGVDDYETTIDKMAVVNRLPRHTGCRVQ